MLGNITVLQVENIKKIKYLDLKLNPNGDLIKIEGPNDAGKSSLLDAIRYAFEGGEIPRDVITHGEKKGTVRIETSGGWIITKVIRKNKKGEQVAELTVRNKDSIKEKAQTFLKEFSSRFIDPTKLIDMNETDLSKAIFEIFRADFSEIDRKIEQIKFDLKVVRKQIKDLGAEPENPELPDNISDMEDVTEKYTKLSADRTRIVNELNIINNKIETNYEMIKENASEIERLREKIKRLEQANDEMRNDIKEAIEQKTELQKDLQNIETKITGLKDVVEKQHEYNELINKKKLHDEWQENRTRLDKAFEKLNNEKETLLNKKRDMIKSLELPIEITDDGIFYNGDRWANLSTSTKLTLAVNMAIKSIPKDGARILYMQRGESIGKEKLKEIIKEAHKNNVQIFMEVFKETDSEGIKITKGDIYEEDFSKTNHHDSFVIDDDDSLF